jgi:hypothetical protein
MFRPHDYYRSVYDIDLDALTRDGIDTLLIDLDNTLLKRDATEVPDEIREWAAKILDSGFKVRIVSNNWHSHVAGVAVKIGFDIVAKALKPFPFAFARALAVMDSDRRRAAVIGDQLFTDVLGGNLMGMRTILVTPLSSSDLPHTLLLRRIEKVLLAERRPLP